MVKNQDIIHQLNQKVRYINKHLNDCLKNHGLYNAQWSIIYYLYKNGAKTQTEITQYFHVEAPTVTRTLKRMEANGWISRTQGQDKRARLIQLTDSAKEKYFDIEKSVASHEEKMLEQLSEEEKNVFYQLIQKLV
ncbi:MarR family winged helix-turn-helix transcriptional regulator [Ornithinibacillus halophilus]|uniref:DNA-binding transcriptional regulator, MarR family n=1 Tax=Ornithinibacillus halophilus TaxID=930117 RepID=A0A1M5IHX4_9BACI|nr:MarR family transcriptional regulator [Ornithinibacillus halophilus]SHG27639.1 DNA-binding transcriptional regulator, MarR family [Ornithinibacillus halophilus]